MEHLNCEANKKFTLFSKIFGIVTHYWMDGLEIEYGWGEILCTRPGAHPAPYTMGNASLPEVKRPGPGVDHSLTSSANFTFYFYKTIASL